MSTLFPYISLIIGGSLRLFDFGKKTIPAAVWLAPIFLLYSTHQFSLVAGMLLVWLLLSIAAFFAYRGVIPVPVFIYPLIIVSWSLIWTLPYLVDRIFFGRIPGFASTLVFPIAWVVSEFITSYVSPFGTWGSIAYTQRDNAPLLQLVSVTGIWGISFLITWFASTINWAWQYQFNWLEIRGGVIIFALIFIGLLVAGGARLTFSKPAKTVRIATIGWPENLLSRENFTRPFDPKPLSGEERAASQKAFEGVHTYFLEESQREASAGAKIIVWPEASLPVFQSDEELFMQHAENLAREQQVYLLMGMATIIEGNPNRLQNKAVLMDPDNGKVFSYIKKNPVPGWEKQISVKSDGILPSYKSPYGLLGAAICYDMDFPQYIRQIGKAKTDILLVPASDWEPIKYLHNIMAQFRAVENGTSLVRATRWGVSSVVDAFGRSSAILNSFDTGQSTMVAQVSTKGVATIYAQLGDWFAWMCVISLIALIAGVISNL